MAGLFDGITNIFGIVTDPVGSLEHMFIYMFLGIVAVMVGFKVLDKILK